MLNLLQCWCYHVRLSNQAALWWHHCQNKYDRWNTSRHPNTVIRSSRYYEVAEKRWTAFNLSWSSWSCRWSYDCFQRLQIIEANSWFKSQRRCFWFFFGWRVRHKWFQERKNLTKLSIMLSFDLIMNFDRLVCLCLSLNW